MIQGSVIMKAVFYLYEGCIKVVLKEYRVSSYFKAMSVLKLRVIISEAIRSRVTLE